MENKPKKFIGDRYRHLALPEIVVLDIPDEYQYMSDELINLVKTSTEAILSA